MAAIPKIDPGDSDAELFSSYNFVIGLTLVVMMGIITFLAVESMLSQARKMEI